MKNIELYGKLKESIDIINNKFSRTDYVLTRTILSSSVILSTILLINELGLVINLRILSLLSLLSFAGTFAYINLKAITKEEKYEEKLKEAKKKVNDYQYRLQKKNILIDELLDVKEKSDKIVLLEVNSLKKVSEDNNIYPTNFEYLIDDTPLENNNDSKLVLVKKINK